MPHPYDLNLPAQKPDPAGEVDRLLHASTDGLGRVLLVVGAAPGFELDLHEARACVLSAEDAATLAAYLRPDR